MRFNIKYILKTFLITLVITIGWYMSTLMLVTLHESVHQEIFEDYGINSRVEYRGFLGLEAVTIPESSCKIEECKLAHNINEVVAYTSYPFMFSLWLGLLILLLFFQERRENGRDT